jgi:phenylacetate-coenzyme A ligase PaaK-like adenylate-forming protein
MGAPSSIGDWPLLEKDRVRASPAAFVNGNAKLATHAATSGTTGVRLEVWRSFRSVAVEQAAIDRLLARVGVRPRTCRVAVLRGDDIKDPRDREPPFWISVAGGRRLVFSSNHLSPATVSEFAAALNAFEPDVRMPTRPRSNRSAACCSARKMLFPSR